MIKKKARDYGKVIISNNCTLVSCEIFNSIIYTVDSDFMIRTWEILGAGDCIQSTIIKQCPKYFDLMSKSDKFRQDQADYSTADQEDGVQRKLDCIDISTIQGKYPELIVVSDETGIVHVNNFATGSIIMSITNRKNKSELTKVHFVKGSSKIYMVATCSDGRVMFFSKPNIQLSKQAQSDDFIQTSIKKGTHVGELYSICSTP